MRKVCLILAFTSFCNLIYAKEEANCFKARMENSKKFEHILNLIDSERIADEIPGITFAAFNENCVFWEGFSGTGDLGGQQSLNPNKSLFRTASVSKLLTVLSVSKLVQEKLLDLESSLLDYDQVPFVKFLKKHETPERVKKWSAMKIKHLMSHQAGISKDLPGSLVFFNSEAIADHAYPSMSDLYQGLLKVEFLFGPAKVEGGIKYSNLAMNLLARLVEGVNREGLSYPDYVKKNIFMPLGMNRSHFDINQHREGEYLVDGHGAKQLDGQILVLPKVYQVGSYDGSIGFATTSVDMAKLGQLFLKLIRFESNPILKDKQLIKTLLTPIVPEEIMALGPFWKLMPGDHIDRDPIWVGHTGTGYGERAIVMSSPERGLGIAINFNSNNVNREKYFQIIAKNLSNAPVNVPKETAKILSTTRTLFKTKLPPAPWIDDKIPATRRELEKYTGSYFADNFTGGPIAEVTLSEDGKRLLFLGKELITEDAAKGLFRMPMGVDYLFNYEPVKFTFDRKGNPMSFTVAQVKRFDRIIVQESFTH